MKPEEKAKAVDRAMIARPADWPQKPLLFLKKRHGSFGDDDYRAVMEARDARNPKPVIYIGHIMFPERMKRKEYENIGALLDDYEVE